MMYFFNRLQLLKVPAEAHVYEKGGNGFGTGTPECKCGNWLDLFRNWLEVQGLVGKS
jgi:hypothetical protein